MKHGISLSAKDPLPCETSILEKKTSARDKPATITTNIRIPGTESRYCINASVRVRPLKLGVQVNWPVIV